MSHKVLINGTAYDATDGTPLIGGTKFQIGGADPCQRDGV